MVERVFHSFNFRVLEAIVMKQGAQEPPGKLEYTSVLRSKQKIVQIV